MIRIRRIKPVYKGKYLMNKIVMGDSKEELRNWRKKNRSKYNQIFYGSPSRYIKGYYALISTERYY